MRPIWKGQISFGLINIPIELYSAEKNHDIKFKLLDSRSKGAVHYQRVNENGEEVPWNEIVKAYKLDKKNYVILEEEDFKRAAITENPQSFEIEDFVSKKSLDCTFFEKPYYLAPLKNAQKGYVLLREILKKTEKIAVGKVIIRTKQYLAAIVPQGDALVMDILRFSDELRDVRELDLPQGNLGDYKISPKEIEMAEKLVESMTVKWNPKKYHNEYRESLMSWIQKKAKKEKLPMPSSTTEEDQTATNVIDFMELLKKSLDTKSKPSKQRITHKRRPRTRVSHAPQQMRKKR